MKHPTAGSYFDGKAIQLIGWSLLATLVTVITLGLCYPWALCMLMRWETRHTVINGRRLHFTGKGGQLFGKYLLWGLLTIITLGIYSFWFSLGMKRWTIKHTVFEDDNTGAESYFSGGAWGWIWHRFLVGPLLVAITAGIATPWVVTMLRRWDTTHTCISGVPLHFDGTGWEMLGNCVLFLLLTPLTLGIYALFFPIRLLKWQYLHTFATTAAQASPEIPASPASPAPSDTPALPETETETEHN